MADYNKGDFTEQGINGTVNALVRLNNKRILDLSVATAGNDEAISNLDINIHDDANGLSYNITGPIKKGTNTLGTAFSTLIDKTVTLSEYDSTNKMVQYTETIPQHSDTYMARNDKAAIAIVEISNPTSGAVTYSFAARGMASPAIGNAVIFEMFQNHGLTGGSHTNNRQWIIYWGYDGTLRIENYQASEPSTKPSYHVVVKVCRIYEVI